MPAWLRNGTDITGACEEAAKQRVNDRWWMKSSDLVERE